MRTRVGGRILILTVLSLFWSGCWGGTYVPTGKEALAAAYVEIFGTPQPPEMLFLHAEKDVIYDSECWWLQFEAPSAVIDSIVNRFNPIDRKSFEDGTVVTAWPKWWRSDGTRMIAFYESSPWHTNFQSSRAFLAHDRDKRVIWFQNCNSN